MNPPSRSSSHEELLAHAGWIQSLARSLMHDSSSADDVVQETWIAALTHPHRREGSTRSWLAAIVHNFARQRIRSESARARRERDSAHGELVPPQEELLERMERQRLLVEAVTRLREPFRTAVILRYYEGLSAAEIARRLGEKPGTVRQRLKRGLDTLREDLDERFGDHQAWLSALIPLVPLPPIGSGPGPAAGTALGGAIVVKKILFTCAALVLIGGAFLALREALTPGEPPVEPAAAELAGDPVERDEVDVASSIVEPGEEVARRKALGPAAEVASPRLEGRVTWPIEYRVTDETLEVLASSEPHDYQELVDRGAEDKVLLSRAKVSAEGNFEMAWPAGFERVHLMVRGRYLYLGHSVEVVLEELDGPLVLDASCGAWIHGTISAPKVQPAIELAGTSIRFWTFDLLVQSAEASDFRSRLELDESLSFDFRAVPPTSTGTLLVLPERCAAHLDDLGELVPGEERNLAIQLRAGGSLRGVVVDREGASVQDARVFAELRGRYFGFDDSRVRETTSAADGTFELLALPPGDVRVSARRPGYLDSKEVVASVADRETTAGVVIELSSGRSLEGSVTWSDGTPAADVAVEVSFDEGFQFGPAAFNALRGASGEARSGDDGGFRVTGLGAGPFVVRASAPPPGGEELLHRARLDGVAGGESGLRLTLLPPQALRGQVVDARGEPMAVFEVHATRVSDGAIGEVATEESLARFDSPDGHFTIGELIGGNWQVVVTAHGCAASELRSVRLPQEGAPPVFTLHPAATIAGVVVTPEGTPVEGAKVEIDSGRSSWQALIAGGPPRPSARSDAAGSFTLAGLPPGEVEIVAVADGFAKNETLSLELLPGEERGGAMLVLTRGGRVTGEVYLDGRAANGQMVNLMKWGRGAFDTLIAHTDEEGRFTFEHVEPGQWQLVSSDAAADWGGEDGEPAMNGMMDAIQFALVQVEEGGEHHVVLGAPPREPVRVHGRVTRGGKPCPGFMISFLSVDPESTAGHALASVSKDGGYEATLDGGGGYLVSLQRMKGAAGEISSLSYPREIPERSEVRLDFEVPGGGIAGRVIGPDGEPAAGARITLMPGRDAGVEQLLTPRYVETSTDISGRYEVPDLDPGSYFLSAGGALFHESSPRARYARVGREISLGRDEWRRDADFSLPVPGRIEVHVTYIDGGPAGGASIYVRDAGGNVLEVLGLCKTDASGRATYAGLAPGEYTICARTGELASEEVGGIRVEADETTRVELEVDSAGWLVVRTRDGAGDPVGSALSVTDSEGREHANLLGEIEIDTYVYAAATGEYRVGPLPPDRYRVTALAPDGSIETKRVSVKADAERKVTLRFR